MTIGLTTCLVADEVVSSENPFNYDLNDLGKWHWMLSWCGVRVRFSMLVFSFSDLDHFCLTIQRELHEVTAVCFPFYVNYFLPV